MKPLPFEITGPYRRNPRSPWRWFVLLLALAAPVFWALFFSSPEVGPRHRDVPMKHRRRKHEPP